MSNDYILTALVASEGTEPIPDIVRALMVGRASRLNYVRVSQDRHTVTFQTDDNRTPFTAPNLEASDVARVCVEFLQGKAAWPLKFLPEVRGLRKGWYISMEVTKTGMVMILSTRWNRYP